MLSCLPVSLFSEIISGRMTPGEWARLAADCGLDAFDISILFVKDRSRAGLAALRKELETGGLPLHMVCTYPDFTVPDPVIRTRELEKEKKDIRAAAVLGADSVRITAGQFYPDADPERQLKQVTEAFSRLAELAEKLKITLLWENHSKPGAWERPDYNYAPERLEKMRAALEGSPVRMNYDIANAYLLGLDGRFAERCLPQIASVHVNDAASVSPIRFAGIGEGKAGVEEALKMLKRLGYQGDFSIEEASGEGIDGIRKYTEVTRRLLEEAGF